MTARRRYNHRKKTMYEKNKRIVPGSGRCIHADQRGKSRGDMGA